MTEFTTADFGFYTEDFSEVISGVPGKIYVCVDLLYNDTLGPRLLLAANTTINSNIVTIFFNEHGITNQTQIPNFELVQKFIMNNINSLLKFWDHTIEFDSISLRDSIRRYDEN